jgi:hypothetical protein
MAAMAVQRQLQLFLVLLFIMLVGVVEALILTMLHLEQQVD